MSLNHRPFLFIAALSLSVTLGHAQPAGRIEASQKLAAEKWPSLGTPGMSVAVGFRNEIAWSAGYGLADIENNQPATADTIYRYASISKPISAVAVMQLVEARKVLLAAPIQEYVPSFPRKPEGSITVRHLLTHTSGIRHYKGGEMISTRRFDTIEGALRIFQDDPLQHPPGTKYLYSSYGYNVIAAVVETVSMETFRDYLRDRLCVPAGMRATDLEYLEENLPDRCRQYVRNEKTGGFTPAPTVDLSSKWAGGGIAGTAEDLIRFCIALDQDKLLQPSSRAQMYQCGKLTDGSTTTYGLGWGIRVDSKERRWTSHSGGATGGTTYLLHNPEERVAVAILCNAQGVKGLSDLAMHIGTLLLDGQAQSDQ